jgi:hypothetical protein
MADLLNRYWKLAIVWALSLIFVGSMSSSAQVRPGSQPLPLELPAILSGSDVGFRIEQTRDGIPVGTIVVRVDGRWVAAESSLR